MRARLLHYAVFALIIAALLVAALGDVAFPF